MNQYTIIYSVIAVILFVLLVGLSYYKESKGRSDSSVSAVMMGDSILGMCRDNTSIPMKLAGLLDEEVINCALGGTSATRMDSDMRLAYTKDCLSMHSLLQSIATSDFAVQQTVRSRENATNYFESTINTLEQIDFKAVDVLFIGHGMNDYQAGVPIYNPEDPYDEYSYTGAIRSGVEMIQEAYPDMRIILLTPTYSWYIFHEEPERTCENCNFGGGTLEDYVKAEIALGESMGVEVIDLYHDFYPHEQWSDWSVYTSDGVHPNEAGRQLIAEAISDYLEANQKK